MSIPEEFPEDLVDEILCRVPATNLKRLRSTCQRWNRLYKDSRFASNHFDKSPNQFFPIMVTMKYSISPMSINLTDQLSGSVTVPSVQLKGELSLIDPKNPSFGFDIARVFHCDGLLLCISEDESRIVVWNPLTGETRWVEPRKGLWKSQTFVLGYCNNTKRYKILSFDSGKNDSEMYDFGSGSWRALDYDITPGWSLSYSDQCVSLKGNAYMFAREQGKRPIPLSLTKFDFSTEKSVPVPLPGQRHGLHHSISLSVVREEKISVLLKHKRTSKTEIWVSNKIDQGTKVVSWSKILALDLSIGLQIMDDSSFLLDEEKKLLLCCAGWTQDEYTFFDKIYIVIVGEDSKLTQVDFGRVTGDGCWPGIHNYVPSLVRIDQAGCKRKTM